MREVVECERCDSKIAASLASGRPRPAKFYRRIGPDDIETEEAHLCSKCLGELWEWVFGDDTPDRSDYADPIPLDRMAESVDRHITDLQGIVDEIEEAKR